MRNRILNTGMLSVVMASSVCLIYAVSVQRLHTRIPSPLATITALSTAARAQTPAGKTIHDLQVLEGALARKPDHTPVLMSLAKLEEERGNLEQSAAKLREIVRRDPRNLDARLELGRVLFRRGDVVGSLDQMQAILELQPGNPDALYNLGAIYGNLGNSKLARQYWQRLVTLDPRSESGRRAQSMLPQLANLSR